MLTAHNLGFRKENRYLIKHINLEYQPGKIYGILGPNGSGKTTLLKTLAGLWHPTEGHVLWMGQLLHKYPRRDIARILTLVSQRPLIQFDYPVFEIVAMGRYSYGFSSETTRKKVTNALKTVDAYHLLERRITELSHGERQRVFLARALVTESPVLLLDEPTTNLDIRHQMGLWKLMRKLANQGKTILVANHDLIASESYCDHIMVINQRRCISKGTFEEALNSAVLASVFGIKENAPSLTRSFSSINIPN